MVFRLIAVGKKTFDNRLNGRLLNTKNDWGRFGYGSTCGTVGVAVDSAGDVVLDYCAAVRGILNDDQGGPLHPPGLRRAEALDEVRQSIDRNVAAKKGGSRSRS